MGTYEYDPWGKVLSVKYAENVNAGSNNDILNLNPFRYRGYYYDTETEFYYLGARYYDPQVKRFISADSVIAGVSDSVTGYNLFAYCDNDPINKTDSSGNFPEWSQIATSSNCKKVAIGVAVIAAVGIVCVATGGTGAPAAVAAVHCFCMGAVQGAAIEACTGAVTGGIQSAAMTAITGGSTDDVIVSFAEGAADGFMWGAITGAVTGGMNSPHCFVAGTIVHTLEGNTPIEQIKAGDYVLSKDEETGDSTYKRVLETYVKDENVLIHLKIEDEEIITTEGHPFYVADKGFIIAKELAINDRLVTSDGTTKLLKAKNKELLKTPVKVYNFAVEDYHTYFVGSGILVHNTCGTEGSTGSKNPYSYLEDGPNVGPGKDFTAAQKQKMLQENMKRNGGVVKSDNPNDFFDILSKPQKSQKGVTPSPDEWQFDHIIPKDKGGTNSYSNCQIVSRKFNRTKWNN